MGRQDECSVRSGHGNYQCRGGLRMKKRKYYLYLTAEERRYIFNVLLDYRNKLITQGKYTDAIEG